MVDLNYHFKTNKNLFNRDGLMRVDRYTLNLYDTINIENITLTEIRISNCLINESF